MTSLRSYSIHIISLQKQFQAAAFLVLLLVPQANGLGSARFSTLNLTSVNGRSVSENAEGEQILTMDLMHFHHLKSPFAKPNLTLAQRVEIAVRSSQGRSHLFHTGLPGTHSPSLSRAALAASYQTPLYSMQGSYAMQIRLGTPPRTLVAIADTGSDLVWVQCSPCKNCFPQPDRLFSPKASSTYKLLSCTSTAVPLFCRDVGASCSPSGSCLYQYGYGDGSDTEGVLAYETITLSSSTAVGKVQSLRNFVFGCGYDNAGDYGEVDGLVGLAQGPLSFVAQLGPGFGNVFSYCLVDFYSAVTRTSVLQFGSKGAGVPMQYTPILKNPAILSFYYVNLVGITVAGTALKYPAGSFAFNPATGIGGLVLDSGTTLSQLATAAYTSLVQRLASLIKYPRVDLSSQGFDLCYNISTVKKPTFPSVVLLFDGVSMALPSENVFLVVDYRGTTCLAFQSNPFISILGNVQQQNFQIVYDLANSRIGFAPQKC